MNARRRSTPFPKTSWSRIVTASSWARPIVSPLAQQRRRVAPGQPGRIQFLTNPGGVTKYWEERLQTNGKYENLYTIGMRGIHDGPMQGPRGDTQIIATLEKISAFSAICWPNTSIPIRQRCRRYSVPTRKLLAYFLKDLKVPPDVTVVFPDDNFGLHPLLPDAGTNCGAAPAVSGFITTFPIWATRIVRVARHHAASANLGGNEQGLRSWDAEFWMLNVGDLKTR